ncbi:MAG: hypothetical protein HQL36_04790 [Alphaproteobacteria bacterium]|nr:hypothetical protein [Alphaproteobacteria bacterium]
MLSGDFTVSTFQTEFPIDPTKTTVDFVKLGVDWIRGMENSTVLSSGYIAQDTDDITIEAGKEALNIARVKTDSQEIFGLKYAHIDSDNLHWTSEFVFTKQKGDAWLSVKVHSDASTTATQLPVPKKPYFIKMIMRNRWAGMDGILPTQDRPHFLSDQDIDLASTLIDGHGKNRLPFVYISAKDTGGHTVNPKIMARVLGGLAHTIVEPNRFFSLRLARETNFRNSYGGEVGVYWPDGAGRKVYNLKKYGDNPKSLTKSLEKDIIRALSNRRQHPNMSWHFLKELIAKQALHKLKEQGSTELNEYFEAFEKDNASLKARLDDAETEITKLRDQLSRSTRESEAAESRLLRPGKERDFYLNERREIIVWALDLSLGNTLEGSRKRHVIEDIIADNNETSSLSDMKSRIKSRLSRYSKMDAKTKNDLVSLGFSISSDGKHYKAVFMDDERYIFTFPKSPSDHRTGHNMVSDINKKLF